jgi:cytoskeletal protein CcmA (bactofilin family)
MFSKKQAVSPQPLKNPARSSMTGSPGFSILGSDTAIMGDITAATDLHIDGKVEGDVTCIGLVQGEHSEIVGSVNVQNAKLAGIVRGTIDAIELVVLRTAQIHGDVHYESLTIEPGAQIDGRFAVRGNRVPEPSLELSGPGEPLLTLASVTS